MGSEHIAPVRLYVTVFACLLALTALTTAVAFADLGRASTVIMLAIAVTKATLVALFFMHLWWSERLTRLVVGGALAWLLLLVGLTLADVLTRTVLG
jgi:cytochrome c oxidase subunit 4